MKLSMQTAIAAAIVLSTQVNAAPPEPIVWYKLTGNVMLANCNAQVADVSIRVSGLNRTVHPTTRQVQANGLVKMGYSLALREPAQGPFTVTPSMRSGVCPGGGWYPTSRPIARIPVAGIDFAYGVAAGETRRIPARDFAGTINLFVRTMKLKLHNNGSQASFVEVGGRRLNFEIPKVRVDLDCGTFCPDLGDANFYVNDVNLKSADFDFVNNAFRLLLEFEDQGREIKGYHSVLGDNGAPDFELGRPKLSLNATLKLTSSGGLAFTFSNPHLDAQIDSTGLCHVGGVDLCNAIFGTDRKIQKGIEKAAHDALNGGSVQAAITAALREYLRLLGIEGPLLSVGMSGGDVVLSIR